jgi:hypothetical protein
METVRLFRVFLSAPSDVQEEHEVLAGVLTDWNIQHGQALRVRSNWCIGALIHIRPPGRGLSP